MSNKKQKTIDYYLNLKWSYTIEQEGEKGRRYYIIRVNELPGVCTDAETLEEGMKLIKEAIKGAIALYMKRGDEIPEPIEKSKFKGKIAYRTTSKRHYTVAKIAKNMHKSISKTMDDLLDAGISSLHAKP